jgi:hypothetical protein
MKKVLCISSNHNYITKGREYEVSSTTDNKYTIVADDDGDPNQRFDISSFKDVELPLEIFLTRVGYVTKYKGYSEYTPFSKLTKLDSSHYMYEKILAHWVKYLTEEEI